MCVHARVCVRACVCVCVCYAVLALSLQDNFKKLVEIEKKLVGDVGGSLITPTRVSWVGGWGCGSCLLPLPLPVTRNYSRKEK